MKTLEEFYKEVQNNEALKAEFSNAFKEGNSDEFLKKHDCEATTAEVMAYIKGIGSQELSDDDLDMVAGGSSGCTTASCSGNETCGCPVQY